MADIQTFTPKSYKETLEQIGDELPRLAQSLKSAEQLRSTRAELLAAGVRFKGLEELLAKLDHVEEAWRDDTNLNRLAFLVRRAIADFETAIEAGLSGYPAAAFEAMRDTMEIELLLLDFYIWPEHIEAWLTSSRRERLKQFAPGTVRKRLIDFGLHDLVGTPNVDADYRTHSESLHVNPRVPAFDFLKKGHIASNDIISLDASFIEIFEHARRLGNALVLTAAKNSPDSAAERACSGNDLKAFDLAYERTREIQNQFLKCLQVALEAIPAEGTREVE